MRLQRCLRGSRGLAALSEDRSSGPIVHIGWLTNAVAPAPRNQRALLNSIGTCAYTYAHIYIIKYIFWTGL